MKVYFAGSIRGGRADAELYARLIDHIRRTDTVLTEHVGHKDVFTEERGMSDEDIYLQDTGWIRECDVVIAECSCPSLGVGYELAYAESLGKPCHILYDKRSSLSAMLAGDSFFVLHPYESEEEIYSVLDAILR